MLSLRAVLACAAIAVCVASRSLQQVAVSTGLADLPRKSNTQTFAVIGDWGRVGALNTCQGGYPNDCQGGAQQVATALFMDRVCQQRGCEYVVNTGDNIYENGANRTDNPSRLVTDWLNIYGLQDKPGINELTWINSIGNHDVLGDISLQIEWSNYTSRWYLPSRFYARDVTAGNTTIKYIVVNTSPFVSSYQVPGQQYYISEVLDNAKPAAIQAQLDFVESQLNSSTATWNVLINHHALYGAHTSYGQDDNSTGWQGLDALLKKYDNVVASFNGHDHAMAWASLPNRYTQFFTSGAGSFSDASDSSKANRSFVQYANGNTTTGQSNGGFLIVTANQTDFVVDFYTFNKQVPIYQPDITIDIPQKSSNRNLTSFGVQGVNLKYNGTAVDPYSDCLWDECAKHTAATTAKAPAPSPVVSAASAVASTGR